MNVSDRNLLLAALGVAVVLVSIVAALATRPTSSEIPTTYSSASRGAKAIYLTLRAGHYDITRWERPPTELPRGGRATLLLAEPFGAPDTAERAAIAQFIEQGGRVIATGQSGAQFLPIRRTDLDPVAGMTWKRLSARSPSAITRASPVITLAPEASWKSDDRVQPLYGDPDGDGALRVVQARIGKGDMIWWASATPVTNAGVTQPGNLAFVLACLGDRQRPILWDEYFHGYRSQAASSTVTSPFAWVTIPFVMAGAALLLTYSRRSGPIVAPAVESRLSPLEFVRTLGSLYERANAGSAAVDIAYQGFRYGLRRRRGSTGDDSPDALAASLPGEAKIDRQAFADVLRACEAAGQDDAISAEAALTLTRALHDYATILGTLRSREKGRI